MLNAAYEGRYECWYVIHVYSPVTWHARPAKASSPGGRPSGSDIATIHAGSPEELVKAIASAELGQDPPDDTSNVRSLPKRK